jgi:DUF4097 and DUF4098 domain-containing protein YvlB
MHTFETPTPPRLDLRIQGGDITIEAQPGLTVTEVTLDGSQEVLEDATVEQRGDTVFVEVRDRKGLFALRDREAVLRVRCPERAAAAIRTKSADVVVRGLLGEIDAATASGDLIVDRVERGVSLKSASGDLQIEEAGGGLVMHTASGDVQAGHVGGAIRANLVSGDLRVREARGPVSVNTVSGDVELDCVVEGTVTVQSVSGDVEVGIRPGSRVHVDASTLSGDTRSDLELGGEPAGEDGPHVELRVKTVSGDVAVVRANREVHL